MKWVAVGRTLYRYWKMAHDPRTPKVVRYLIYGGIFYSLSPIDLVPDWVPGLGLLDDAAVVPSLIALSMLLIPREVKEAQDLNEHKEIEQSKKEAAEAR